VEREDPGHEIGDGRSAPSSPLDRLCCRAGAAWTE